MTTTEIRHVCYRPLQAPNAFIFSFLSNKREEREAGGSGTTHAPPVDT